MQKKTGSFPIFKLVAVVLLLAATLKIFVLDAVVVSSGSMEATLRPGDFLIIDKTGYAPPGALRRLLAGPGLIFPFLTANRVPSRGEVVAFNFPGRTPDASSRGGDPDAVIIKRCVATAGDSLRLDGGVLRVNGVPVAAGLDSPGEFFLNPAPRRVPRAGDRLTLDSAGCPLWRDLIFSEGHRLDHDALGRPTIDGTPSDTYTAERSYLFVLGDNLASSRDSRAWGFLPADRVIGTAMIIYWSLGADGSVRWDRVGTFVE